MGIINWRVHFRYSFKTLSRGNGAFPFLVFLIIVLISSAAILLLREFNLNQLSNFIGCHAYSFVWVVSIFTLKIC